MAILIKDIFDRIQPDRKSIVRKMDIFDGLKKTGNFNEDEIRNIIRDEIRKIPVSKSIDKIIEKMVIEKTPEKIIVKEMMKMEDVLKEIDEKIKEFKKQVYEKINSDIEEKTGLIIVSQPLPAMHQQQGKVLTNDGSQAKWGGGGASNTYTPTNVTTTFSFDATLTSLDELANVVATLIQDLQNAGIIK